jgi:hypothetical protein
MALRNAIILLIVIIVLTALAWWQYARVVDREPPAPLPPPPEPREIHALPAEEEPESPAVRSYMDVVLATHRGFPTTQPLGVPLDLDYAARVVLDDPIHLCSRRDLWITRPDGLPAAAILDEASREQTHVIQETVLYVHWTRTDGGSWSPALVCPGEGGSAPELVTADGRIPLPAREYDWPAAMSWGKRLIVPSARGVSVMEFEPALWEAYGELLPTEGSGQSGNVSRPQVLFHGQGLLAWAPWEAGRVGSRGAARYVDGKWESLGPEERWPERLMHLVPLLDGSVLQIVVRDDGLTGLELRVLGSEQLDERRIEGLVEQLSDRDPEKRETAYHELTRYGPGSWPVLERLMDEQPVEARVRMQELLRNRLRPTLGGMRLMAGDLQVVTRLADGGVVLYSDAGVSMPRRGESAQVVSPAWISIRPGRAVQLLPAALAGELSFGRTRLDAVGDRWMVTDPAHGARQFLGNHLRPLLEEEEYRQFDRVVGVDRRGRWLLTTTPPDGRTLLIDPTLPDPTPRLPVWAIEVPEGLAGWTEDDWPAVKHGGAWALHEVGWRPLDEATAPMPTEAEDGDDAIGGDAPLLVAGDGTTYYDGRSTLRAVSADGEEVAWPLPEQAVGEGRPHLLEAGEGRLFLFNQPGRVVRIRRQTEGPQPFALEAIFTRDIPNTPRPQRIWLDPAGRIIIAHGGNRLAVLFPEGRIPREIALLMPER